MKVTQADLPLQIPIWIKKGETYQSATFKHYDSSEIVIDPSGWTITAELRDSLKADAELLATFSVTQDSTGYSISLTDSETDELDKGNYFYGIKVDTGTVVKTYFGGTASVERTGAAWT